MYVTLEPCCHHGKTPPCADAVIAAGLRRVVIALGDPFPGVDGGGIATLRAADIEVDVGVGQAEASELNRPYLRLIGDGRPWVIAKWAMTLDGKIATREGDSRWVSSEASRAAAHRLRGRMDAVIVGRTTAERDDPLLTARPPGPRTPLRVVLDTRGALASGTQLVRTARQVPVLVAAGAAAAPEDRRRLQDAGCEVLVCDGATHAERFEALLAELGRRRMTNVLVEGGGRVLGSLHDAGRIDEVHVFVAPKLVGGGAAPGPLAGEGVAAIGRSLMIDAPQVERLGGDIYVHGRVRRRRK
jgi:diaminohydroxyphosphoribosylaminopyrimidine deaminase/5-amino-6-(5-phosphoribosylamino)uracil reductase